MLNAKRSGKAKWAMPLVSLVALIAAGCGADPRLKDETLLDTGLALSEALQAYDVDRYVLRHEILPQTKSIAGSSTIEFTAVKDMSAIELDFDGAYKIDRVEADGAELVFSQTPHKLTVTLAQPLAAGGTGAVTVHYAGKPVIAPRAPWDGGFVWTKTPTGADWVATAIQGDGCDLWYPCKDHPLGEPRKGYELHFTTPAGLVAATNGVLKNVEELQDGRRTYSWRTNVSTNIYGVALNVAPYELLEGTYQSVNGTQIPLRFYHLPESAEKAKVLFEKEFPAIIRFFEQKLGPYPWGEEKMGVVETPHLGMEHQTINAYGNEYKRGDGGYDWLLHHEFAHEWFGNLMSVSNNADMWLHEGTAAYMQPVYAQELMGDAVFHALMYKSYLNIRNCAPVAPRQEMSEESVYKAEKGGPGGDIYAKGAWVLHSLRYLMGDEAFWNALQRLVYDTDTPETLKPPMTPRFRTTDDFVAIAGDTAGQKLDWFFEVYTRRADLPRLETTTDGADLVLTWRAPDDLPFPMPVPVRVNGELRRLEMPGGVGRIAGGATSKVEIDPMLDILRALPSLPSCEERTAAEEKKKAADAAKTKRFLGLF